jgi:hypothetical protein
MSQRGGSGVAARVCVAMMPPDVYDVNYAVNLAIQRKLVNSRRRPRSSDQR